MPEPTTKQTTKQTIKHDYKYTQQPKNNSQQQKLFKPKITIPLIALAALSFAIPYWQNIYKDQKPNHSANLHPQTNKHTPATTKFAKYDLQISG